MRTLVMVVCATAMVGCAGMTVRPVRSYTADCKEEGFRYYEAAPYLLVYTDNKGGLTSKLIYLPDTTKKMSVHPYNFMASNKVNLKFKDGVLTNATSNVDETAVPKALLSALEKVATAAVKAGSMALMRSPENKAPAPYLFKIIVQGSGAVLKGGQGLGPNGEAIEIMVPDPTKKG